MPHININSDAVVVYANKLEKLKRSAMPVAVRQTLNRAAMDVKRVTMPVQSDRVFKKRKPTFFSATSKVQFAAGLEVNVMQSVVGFISPAGKKEAGHATADLQQQEHGGDIDKRAFIATDKGRTARGNVKGALTMDKIKALIIDAKNAKGHNDKEKYIKSAIHVGKGGFVIGTSKNGRRKMLMQILSVHRQSTGDTVVNARAIYDVEAKRKAHVKATHFMAKASEVSAKKMPQFFNEQAEIAITKALK